jgi:hypothetical protein
MRRVRFPSPAPKRCCVPSGRPQFNKLLSMAVLQSGHEYPVHPPCPSRAVTRSRFAHGRRRWIIFPAQPCSASGHHFARHFGADGACSHRNRADLPGLAQHPPGRFVHCICRSVPPSSRPARNIYPAPWQPSGRTATAGRRRAQAATGRRKSRHPADRGPACGHVAAVRPIAGGAANCAGRSGSRRRLWSAADHSRPVERTRYAGHRVTVRHPDFFSAITATQ